MSAYISDTTLGLCLDLLLTQYQLCVRIGSEKLPVLADAIDEITAGISGITIEQAREMRLWGEEQEKKLDVL